MSDCAARWRVGGKVPINVYKDNQPVCQCQTKELAAEIVAGMNVTPCPPAAPALTRQQAEQMAENVFWTMENVESFKERQKLLADALERVSGTERPHMIMGDLVGNPLELECGLVLHLLAKDRDRLAEIVAELKKIIQEDSRFGELVELLFYGPLREAEANNMSLTIALRSLRDAVNAKLNRAGEPSGSLEAALTHADAVLAREAQ